MVVSKEGSGGERKGEREEDQGMRKTKIEEQEAVEIVKEGSNGIKDMEI